MSRGQYGSNRKVNSIRQIEHVSRQVRVMPVTVKHPSFTRGSQMLAMCVNPPRQREAGVRSAGTVRG